MDRDQSVEFVCEYVGFNKADSSVMELEKIISVQRLWYLGETSKNLEGSVIVNEKSAKGAGWRLKI